MHMIGQMCWPTLESSNLVNQCLESLCLWIAYRVGIHNCNVHGSTHTQHIYTIVIGMPVCEPCLMYYLYIAISCPYSAGDMVYILPGDRTVKGLCMYRTTTCC